MSVLRFLDKRIEEIIIVFGLGTMTLAIGLQVFMRYIMQNSLSWSEELARYLFIFFVYAGISYGVKKKRHIKVEAFTMWLPAKAQAYIQIVSDLLFLAFAAFAIYFGAITAARVLALRQVSPALDIPMGYISATLPFGYALTAIRLLQNLRASIAGLVGAKNEGGR